MTRKMATNIKITYVQGHLEVHVGYRIVECKTGFNIVSPLSIHGYQSAIAVNSS